MKKHFSLLQQEAQQFKCQLRAEHLTAFERYALELLSWNKRINLTAVTSPEAIAIKHFLDSLTIAPFIEGNDSLLDIGSGAGFPGIPLKIVFPELQLTTLDAVQKKVLFQRQIGRVLEISFTSIHGRTENIQNDYRRQFQVVVARAFAGLSGFIAEGEPFLAQGGTLIAMKGREGTSELKEAAALIKSKNLSVIDVREFSLPLMMGDRTIIVLKSS